jgi:hypothetical protein
MIELESIPTVLHVPKNSHGNKLIVGFSDGRVILFRINVMIMDGNNDKLMLANYKFHLTFHFHLQSSKRQLSSRKTIYQQ